MLVRVVVVLLASVAASSAYADKAADLIAKGEKLFAEKKVAEATTAFRQAVNADKKNALARFHWARGMAALRASPKHEPCGPQGIGKGNILTQLRQAVALDPSLRERARADAHFGDVHDQFAWHHHVLGRALDQDADLDAILRGVGEWHGKSNGVCYHTYLRFQDGGVVEEWVRDVKSQDDLTCVTRRTDVGTYTVKDGTVAVKLKSEKKPKSGKLSKGGKLLLPDPGPYNDDALECAM
jgi:hypothetical protein